MQVTILYCLNKAAYYVIILLPEKGDNSFNSIATPHPHLNTEDWHKMSNKYDKKILQSPAKRKLKQAGFALLLTYPFMFQTTD